jgi:hypothetical protein
MHARAFTCAIQILRQLYQHHVNVHFTSAQTNQPRTRPVFACWLWLVVCVVGRHVVLWAKINDRAGGRRACRPAAARIYAHIIVCVCVRAP